MPSHNIRIYTNADTALRAEDMLLAAMGNTGGTSQSQVDRAVHETSLAHFCAFVDFYTRKASDPMSTSLACEKQAEAVDLSSDEVNSENMRMLINTMLEAIDHLEKKWLDEQIRHEERQRQHREDVARLAAQLRDLQKCPRKISWYQRGVQAVQNMLLRGGRNSSEGTSGRPKPKPTHSSRPNHPVHAVPA